MQRSFRGSSMAWLVCKPAIVANCAAVLFKRLREQQLLSLQRQC